MPARQLNATTKNPNGLPMQIAARYSRVIGASIARAWENVRDWEHLPYLHADSFTECQLEEEGPWGWRATTKGTRNDISVIEVAVDESASRYVSRTLEGGLPGVEIWTRLTKLADHQTQVDVEFHLPHLTQAQAEKAGQNLIRLYTQLWDEDEAMMIARQEALDARDRKTFDPIPLGPLDILKADLPRVIESASGPIVIAEHAGALTAYPARCPHLKAPLAHVTPDKCGTIVCPWHGYRFDITTGLSADGRGLKLGPMPRIKIDDDAQANLVWT